MKALLLLFAMTATAVAADRPVDWTKLLQPSLTGTVALEEQGDGTKIVTLASKRLFALYLECYGVGKDLQPGLGGVPGGRGEPGHRRLARNDGLAGRDAWRSGSACRAAARRGGV